MFKNISSLLLLFILFISNSYSYSSEKNCASFSRAVVTDQKNLTYALAFDYLQINPALVISLGTDQYESWRGGLNQCVVDIYHFTEFELTYKSPIPGERCTVTIDTYVLDHFSTTNEREIKPRNVVRKCYQENAEQMATSKQCAAAPKCPISNDGIYIQDYSNNCECILLDKVIEFEDVVNEYEDFYNPDVDYRKPHDIEDLFDN